MAPAAAPRTVVLVVAGPGVADELRQLLDVLARPFVAGEVRARVAATARLGRAEARLDEMEAWSHRAAHDLATPLAVISMVAETLHDSWGRLEDADRQRLLSSMRNQAERTRGMLDEAIAVARGEPAPPAGDAKETEPLSGQPPRP